MRKGGSKPKGASAEREVAKMFSLWWTNGEADDIFYITAGSGARQTTRRKQGKDTANSAGDLNYLDIDGKLLIDSVLFEIKRGYNNTLDLLSIVDAKRGKKPNILLQWITKAEQEREENNRQYIFLVIKRDYKEYFILFPVGLSSQLAYLSSRIRVDKTIIIQHEYILMPLEDFFIWLSPDNLKVFLKSQTPH